MFKFLIIFLSFQTSPKPQYLIVTGDITCKSCVIDLHKYLRSKTKNSNITIVTRDKGSIVANDLTVNYLKNELPTANFNVVNTPELFAERQRYPYLLRIVENDSLKFPYDSLFKGEDLNKKYLRSHCRF